MAPSSFALLIATSKRTSASDEDCPACAMSTVFNIIKINESQIFSEQFISESTDNDILFSMQKDQKGTGHAVMQTQNHLENFDGNTLVLSGDVPLISKDTLHSLIVKHEINNYDATMLTAEINNPTGYGRVIRDNKNNLKYVCEHKDCNEQELKINEINSGIYVFNNKLLFDLLPKLDNDNAQAEYYLPDVLTLIVNSNGNVGLKRTSDFIEIQAVSYTHLTLPTKRIV